MLQQVLQNLQLSAMLNVHLADLIPMYGSSTVVVLHKTLWLKLNKDWREESNACLNGRRSI